MQLRLSLSTDWSRFQFAVLSPKGHITIFFSQLEISLNCLNMQLNGYAEKILIFEKLVATLFLHEKHNF